jgi:hypothetical protein
MTSTHCRESTGPPKKLIHRCVSAITIVRGEGPVIMKEEQHKVFDPGIATPSTHFGTNASGKSFLGGVSTYPLLAT